MDRVRDAEKRPGRSSLPDLSYNQDTGSDLGRPFCHGFLDRLVGIARDRGVHLAELRCLGHPGVVCLLGVLGLDFDDALKRLCADQLLEGAVRDVEELLAERGIDASYETVRRWFLKFGPSIAANGRDRAIIGTSMKL